MPTVLVCANILFQKEVEYADCLRQAGFDLRWPKLGFRQLIEPELRAELPGVDATIAGSEPYTPAILESFPQLRVIARTGVGSDSIDIAAATRHGVAVAITPGTNHESVAEQAFALLLAVARRVVPNHLEVAGGRFERPIPRPLRGKTLGLFGLGRAGGAMAVRAHAFGMTVVAADPYASAIPAELAACVRLVTLDELLATSDAISLHAPLTEETRSVINATTIARMKPGVWIINTARGGLIDESDLAQALACGIVGGAGLDVFSREPPAGSPLLTAPNVVYSPHLAGIDATACNAMGLLAAQNIVDLWEGRWPADRLVNARQLALPWRWSSGE